MDGVRREPHAGKEQLVAAGVPETDAGAAVGLRAALLFAATGLMIAITVAGIRISGWRAGVLDNRIEWLFWAGAILSAVGVAVLGIAAVPGRGSARAVGAGVVLFLLGPVLCTVAVFADYWI